MQEIKVSVVIPVYNVEKYLPQCLDSCINQTLKEIEIVCVNDGSTDKSLEILYSYAKKDPRIKVVTQSNQGAGAAKNLGASATKGEYLIFVDSDDWLEPNALNLLYEKIKTDNADIVFFNCFNYYEETERKDIYKFADVYYSRFKEKPFSPSAASDIIFNANGLTFKIYKRKLWVDKDIKFSAHKFVEDSYPFFKFLLNAETASVLNLPVYNYRRHVNSSSSNPSKYISDIFDVYELCEKEILKKENYDIYANSFVNNRISQMLYWYKFVDKSQKKFYYTQMKKYFIRMSDKFGAEAIEKSSNAARVNNILTLPFFIEDFWFKFKSLITIIKTQRI